MDIFLHLRAQQKKDKYGKIAQTYRCLAYLNSGRSQSIRWKKIIKNCDTANNVKSRKNVYLMCMFIVKNDVKSVKNEKRLKIKRENNNSGLLLC